MTEPSAHEGAHPSSGLPLPQPLVPGDDGASSPELQAALAALAAGHGSAVAVLEALAASRLFVPVVAVLDASDVGTDGIRREKSSSMATVLVESADHGRAQLAFGSIGSLTAWSRQARPVAVTAPDAARAAVGEGADALVVDIGGPVPFALTGSELLLMASLADRGPSDRDPVLQRAVTDVVRRIAPKAQLHVDQPAEGTGGPVVLSVDGVADPLAQAEVVRLLSNDRVVTQLLPDGMRVTFGDTP